jgi:arylsulfatase A-like enzyme
MSKPNLLFVFSDEHRACSMPGEPYCDVQAPNLAQLASEGISFANCISSYPLCSPYRAILLTGRWPYQTGMIDNALQLRSEEFSLGTAFRQQGYRTGYIGKWHLSPGDDAGEYIPPGPARQGFEDWQMWSNTSPHFDQSFTFDPDTGEKIQPKGYNCTLMTDAALRFLDGHAAEPWMLILSWSPPHPPFGDAPPLEMNRYDPEALRLRPNVTRQTPGLRRRLQGYYGHISALDTEIGRLLRKLEETRQAQHTIVVYTSDHGTMMDSQGFRGKRLPWDESCKVPFLLRYPEVVPANRIADTMISAIDLFPSLCRLAGVPVPQSCMGSDLSGAMRGDPVPSPESVFLMHIRKDNASRSDTHPAPLFRGVRSERYTYAVADDGRWCLYENIEDPYQTRNLIDEPGHARVAGDLDGLILEWLEKARDPFPFETVRRQRSARS